MNESVRLRHMLDAAEECLTFTEGRTVVDLSRDRLLVLALVKEIEIIGVAAAKIGAEVKAASPDIPWPDIVGMRNRLIHSYSDVNLEVVWSTVSLNLPELIEKLRELLKPTD